MCMCVDKICVYMYVDVCGCMYMCVCVDVCWCAHMMGWLTQETDNVGMREPLHQLNLLRELVDHLLIGTRESLHCHRDLPTEASYALKRS